VGISLVGSFENPPWASPASVTETKPAGAGWSRRTRVTAIRAGVAAGAAVTFAANSDRSAALSSRAMAIAPRKAGRGAMEVVAGG
jgi:hypothetical protein